MKRRKLEEGTENKAEKIPHFLMKRESLVSVLGQLKLGLAKGAILEQMGHFMFAGGRVYTYNSEICISAALDVGFTGSVRAEELYSILDSMTDDETVTIIRQGEKKSEQNQVLIKGKKVSCGLPLHVEGQAMELIDLLNYDKIKWKKLPKDFIEGASLCSFSASADLAMGILTGVFFDGRNIFSSDNYRISWYKMTEEVEHKCVIKAQVVGELPAYEPTKYCIEESWAHFKTDSGIIISSRLLGLDYFPSEKQGLNQYFPKKQPKGVELPKKLKVVLDRAGILLKEELLLDKEVTLAFSKGKVICRSMKKDRGWFEEIISMPKQKQTFTMKINPEFLIQIMKHSPIMRKTSTGTALFSSGKFKHIMSLVK